MLSVSEARARILAKIPTVESILEPISDLAGRTLSEDITAKTELPLFDHSTVDGFAVRSSDTENASSVAPKELTVIDDIRAGMVSRKPIEYGKCARIMTGAPLPPGAEAVVMVEDTDFNDRNPGSIAPKEVAIQKTIQIGENVRHHGDDLQAGQLVLTAGKLLRAQEIGLLAMLGYAFVPVYRKPKAALLSSGDELLPVEVPLTPGKIHDANSYILSAACESAGVELIRLGVASDNELDVSERLLRAADEKADVIITSAGVSVGAFDYVKKVVESEGKLDFWTVNIRPGKPLAFGNFHGIPFFGLPGNPVSAFVGFEVFIRPALERLSGRAPQNHPSRKAILVEAVESDGRESYLRAITSQINGQLSVRLTGHQGSGNIFSLVQANALLIVPSGVKSLPAGSEVEIWPIQ